MYGIFMESWVIFKLYGGSGFLLVLYILSLALMLIKERERPVRILFCWMPLAVLFLFFFPIFRKAYVRFLGAGDTQYRVLWLLPMGMTVARSGCLLVSLVPMRGEHLLAKRILDRVLLPVLACVLIAVAGTCVYANSYVTPAENAWHIPQEAIEVTDLIAPEHTDGKRVRAAVPSDLVHFIRQYNTDVVLAFGRDIIAYGYYNEIYERMEQPETVIMAELDEALREAEVDFLVLKKDRKIDADPATAGWQLYGETETYRIYRID